MQNDPEKDVVEVNYVSGYPSLAAFIASDPDHSTAIYRRFDRLSARNLLYLQTELAVLEKKQDELDKQDFHSDDLDVKEKASDWELLIERAESGSDDEAQKRFAVARAIREKIKEYSEDVERENFGTMLTAACRGSHPDGIDDLVLPQALEADIQSLLQRVPQRRRRRGRNFPYPSGRGCVRLQ